MVIISFARRRRVFQTALTGTEQAVIVNIVAMWNYVKMNNNIIHHIVIYIILLTRYNDSTLEESDLRLYFIIIASRTTFFPGLVYYVWYLVDLQVGIFQLGGNRLTGIVMY